MLRRNKQSKPFRSFTDINNYNQFLLQLDTSYYTNQCSPINDPINEPNSTINDILNHVDKSFGLQFTSNTKMDPFNITTTTNKTKYVEPRKIKPK